MREEARSYLKGPALPDINMVLQSEVILINAHRW